MKKKNLLLAIPLLLGSLVALSQAPSLTTGNVPVAGDVFSYFTAGTTNVTPGASGASQTWDFTTLSVTTTTKNESYQTPTSLDDIANGADTVTCSRFFPNANIALYDVFVLYFSAMNNQYINWGYVTPGLIIRPYSDIQILFTYPFTFNSSVNDNYSAQYKSNFGSGTEVGVSSTVGDGWGTLKLPSKTYNNVLRVKYTDVFKDSATDGTITPIHNTVVYAWYDGVHKQPVLKITQEKGVTVSVLVFSSGPNVGTGGNTSVKDITSTENHFEVFPNPTTHQKSIISYNLKEKSDVTISLYNIIGVKVKTLLSKQKLNTGNYSEEINVQDLAKGLYIVNININGVSSQGKLFVE